MLAEYKKVFTESASVFKDWKKWTNCESCNKYLEAKENNDPLLENYFSVVMLKYWYIADCNYRKQQYKTASEEDCYAWLVDGIMYALDKHVWTDPENVLYKDQRGPTKAIEVRVESLRCNFYTAINRQMRKVHVDAVSLDEITEETTDGYYTPYYDKYDLVNELMDKKINEYFTKKDYLSAFILDGILYYDTFEVKEYDGKKISQFSRRSMNKYLADIDDNFCEKFAKRYHLACEEVKKSVPYIHSSSRQMRDKRLTSALKRLSRDLDIRAIVGA